MAYITEYQNKVTDPERPWMLIPDTEENILADLAHHTLDPVFERYGNFANPNPVWTDPRYAEKYKGCTSFFGNFVDYSHAFRLVTNDPGLIERLTQAITQNKATKAYQDAKIRMIERETAELERRTSRKNA